MQVLKTLQTNSFGDSDVALLDNWPRGLPAEGLWVDVAMPVAVATPGTPTAADLRAVLDAFLGVFSLSYGREKQFKPYIGVKGSKLRHAHRAMTMGEVFNDFVGVAQTAGNKTFRARLFLTPNRQKAKGKRRLIGWTQGGTIEVKIEEAAALVAGALGLTRNGAEACVVRIVPAYRVGPDGFSHLPFYREINRDALDLTGPDGQTIAFWDDNAAFAATAITKYSLRIGDTELIRQVEPKYVDQDYSRLVDAGGSDFTDEVTLLHVADPYADEREIPTGVPYLTLVNQDVATIKGRFLYLPPYDDSEVTAIVTEAAALRGEAINAVLPEPTTNPSNNGSQSVAPIEFIPRRDARFDTEPGIRADVNGGAQVFVPAHVPAVARGLPAPMIQRYQKVTSLRVPGATSSTGDGRRGTIRDTIRRVFGGLL